MSARLPHFEYWQSGSGGWYFHLRGANGQIQLVSEAYKTRGGVLRGIGACQLNTARATVRLVHIAPIAAPPVFKSS